MRNGLLILASCLILALAGCGGEGPRPISVSGGTIQIGDVTCEPARSLIRRLERCGLSPEERQRALKLMLAEKKRRLAHAKEKLSRLRPSKHEVLWMARTLMGEAEDEYGMTLVGNVALERAEAACWPNTIPEVVRERWQFTSITRNDRDVLSLELGDYSNGDLPRHTHNQWRRSVRMAHAVLALPDTLRPPEAHGFANLQEANYQPWMSKWPKVYRHGSHTYYRRPDGCGTSHNIAQKQAR